MKSWPLIFIRCSSVYMGGSPVGSSVPLNPWAKKCVLDAWDREICGPNYKKEKGRQGHIRCALGHVRKVLHPIDSRS